MLNETTTKKNPHNLQLGNYREKTNQNYWYSDPEKSLNILWSILNQNFIGIYFKTPL